MAPSEGGSAVVVAACRGRVPELLGALRQRHDQARLDALEQVGAAIRARQLQLQLPGGRQSVQRIARLGAGVTSCEQEERSGTEHAGANAQGGGNDTVFHSWNLRGGWEGPACHGTLCCKPW